MGFVTTSAEQITKINRGLPGLPPGVLFEQDAPYVAADVRAIYCDPVSGDDTNDGLTSSTAVRDLQVAINMYFPASRGMQSWAVNDNRVIHVLGSAGTVMTKSVVVPPHAGLGALIIQGQETTVEPGLLLAGTPFSAIVGYQIDQTLNLLGAALTPSSYQYNAFVKPQVSLAETEFDAGYDALPIRDNGASDLTVTAYDPGVWSAFSYSAGALVDIVQPNITWRPEDATATAFINAPAITNFGGALIVRGFEIQAASVGGNFGCFLMNSSAASPLLGASTLMQRSIVTDTSFSPFVDGNGVGLMGIIYDDPAAYPKLCEGDVIIQNFLGRCGFLDCPGPQRTAIYGMSLDTPADAVGGLSMSNNFVSGGHVAADLRASGTEGTQFRVLGGAVVHFGPISVEGAKGLNCVQVENAYADFKIGSNAGRTTGSAGNNGVGLDLSEGSFGIAGNEASITLSGTGGDMTVGALPARAWTAGSQTDPTELSRFST